ncbi:glycosyltransferase [Anaerotruncus rubiinfantis]|uniref:glycosyltransferase n=1 Tax=Anaerotruncus rubiinfantis TaxID=1720200 RepID=UPI0034A1EA7D
MPRVSVLMGVYLPGEGTAGLAAAVESVLAQTFSGFEFLICDDGSSAAAQALLDGYAARDGRVRVLRGSGAKTLPEKLNCCIKAARGELFARQDADDLSLPKRFESQVAFLDAHPETAFVGCNVNIFCGGETCGERRFPEYPQKEDFRFSMPFIHPSLVFRADAVRAVGGYSESKRAVLCEDYDLLLRLYAKGYTGYNLQEKLFSYQVGPDDWKKRRYRHRVNEAVTRFCRFGELGMLPGALPYVIKPLAVGLLPHGLVEKLRRRRNA